MKKFVCINDCFFNGRLYKSGDLYITSEDFEDNCFQKIEEEKIEEPEIIKEVEEIKVIKKKKN